MRGLIKSLLIFSFIPVQAYDLKLAWARILLVDLGSIIKSQPLATDTGSLRIYALSGLNDEDDRSIIAIQGIAETTNNDISINTEAGIITLHLSGGESPDLILNPERSRSCIISKNINIAKGRSIIIETDSPFNKYILASRPDLLRLKHLVSENDPAYFRTIVLQANEEGLSDIVIATKARVYKFTVNIGGQNNEHTERLKLSLNSCKR